MTGYFAITGSCVRFLPSTNIMSRLCHDGESFTFHDVIAKVENFEGRTNAGIVINGESIFDIRVINVFLHKTLIAID